LITKSQEQLAIIEHAKNMQVGDILKIEASAGCAKSSSLVFVAEEVVVNSICLVFNKVSQEDASKLFPEHVECKTTHALAYRTTGITISHKLTRPQGNYVNVLGTGNEIAKYFKLDAYEQGDIKLPPAYLGLLVKYACNKFEQSAEDKITKDLLLGLFKAKEIKESHHKALSKLLLPCVKKLYELRSNPESDVLATHDTYLKMYQLTKPQLGYEVIYLDEAQDSNECVLDIVANQKGSKVILVGDSDQAIYGWRGAINALQKVKGTVLPLSTSYRYGQESADLAMKILDNGVVINSAPWLSTTIGRDVVDKSKPYTVLYRTNEKLIVDAVDQLARGVNINLEIDVRDFCNLLNSAIALYRGVMKDVKHEELLCYNDYVEFKEEAENDASFNRIVGMIESNTCWKVLKALQEHKNTLNPHITYTTAHKSKGREWPQVELGDDYPRHYRNNKWVGLSKEEQNLLYVASTRTITALNINKTIGEIWFGDVPKETPQGLQINIKGINLLSAGASKYKIADIIDKHRNQDHRLDAYESFLNDDLNTDEYACDSFEGELNLLPDVRNMRFPI